MYANKVETKEKIKIIWDLILGGCLFEAGRLLNFQDFQQL